MVTHAERRRHSTAAEKIISFIKSNVVLVVAFLAAVITSCIVTPDEQYISYFDFKTLTCLFCTLAVICALKDISFFTIIARRIVALTGDIRRAIITIVIITFVGSMLIANDMALPLGYFVLRSSGQQKYMIFTFIMQNIGANLGGMLTPFGNPQNLYLYNKFGIPTGEFMKIMAIPFVSAIALILICCFIFVKKEKITVQKDDEAHLPLWRTALYLALFAFSIAIVFRSIPYYWGLVVIPAVLLIADRSALRHVDYGLLMTFVCFFIFSGNMSRIEAVNHIISALLAKKHTARQHRVLSVYKQRSVGDPSFGIHRKLPCIALRSQHRRDGNYHSLACKSYNVQTVLCRRAGRGEKVSASLQRLQLCISYHNDGDLLRASFLRKRLRNHRPIKNDEEIFVVFSF